MNSHRQHFLALAATFAASIALAQAPADPVADLFMPRPPLPAGAETAAPAPLRLPDAPPQPVMIGPASAPIGPRPAPPRRVPFELKPDAQVLFLGDALLEAEGLNGYLETRLDSNAPTNRFRFRNLSSSPANPLRSADPAGFDPNSAAISNLLQEVRQVKPGVIVLSYGTAPALQGLTNLVAFTNAYAQLLDRLSSIDTSAPPRLVLLSPLSFEPSQPGTSLADITNHNLLHVKYAEAVWRLSTNRSTEFVDLYTPSRNEVAAAQRATERGKEVPSWTEDGLKLTPYGVRRMSFALDRGLRWPGNNWRFGLMADSTWRPGGFGAVLHSRERSDQHAKVVFTEERLPTPNLAAAGDPTEEAKPLCYIQLRSLTNGLYDLRVDGRKIVTGSHVDWDRYEIISRGPSWDQAEELRQTIVKKNQLWDAWMQRQRAAGLDKPIAPDPQIGELEAKIAQLKRPLQRTYEWVRTGDAPPTTNTVIQLPAAPAAPAAPTPPAPAPAK